MKLTELEAINQMLLSLGMHPAATVDDLDVYSEAVIARSNLKVATMETLLSNWHFNTLRLELQPDTNGSVLAPAGTIDVFCPPQVPYELVIKADGRLKDILNDTEVFTAALDVYVVKGFPWDEIPATHQLLILGKAKKRLMKQMKGSKVDTRDVDYDILQAEAACRAWDTRQRRYSMLDSLRSRQHVSQNWTRG